jgi:small subunit ribosomal protein S3
VGQKTHPTGFRIGVNKTHSSKWFAAYGVYSDVLKEDYKIREFFEKKFESIYSKAGITKLEIQRKINQLELTIHAARPKAIALDAEKDSFILNLKNSIKALVSESKQVRIKVLQVTKSENEGSLVARSIGDQLEKRVAFRRAIRQAIKRSQVAKVAGIKVQISGRLNGAEMARSEWIREGRVPLHTLRANIDYADKRANTIYGVLGVKVWLFKGETL